jgi:hypothetical protein
VEKVLQAPRNGTLLEAAEALEATGSVVKLGMLSYCTHPYLTGLICAVCGEKGVQPEQMKRIFVKGGHELSVSKVCPKLGSLTVMGVSLFQQHRWRVFVVIPEAVFGLCSLLGRSQRVAPQHVGQALGGAQAESHP